MSAQAIGKKITQLDGTLKGASPRGFMCGEPALPARRRAATVEGTDGLCRTLLLPDTRLDAACYAVDRLTAPRPQARHHRESHGGVISP